MSFAHLLELNRQRSQPLYRQIAEQIRVQIGEGRLPAGTRLPTVRQLAETLGVTRVTAQNAYSELQASGLVESTVGRGTFVVGSPQTDELITAIVKENTPDQVMNTMQLLDQIAGLRSFAYAEPDPAMFPLDDFRLAFNSISDSLQDLMLYASPQGDPALRVEIAAMLGEQGIACVPDDIIVTTGVSQGLSLVTLACLDNVNPAIRSRIAVDQPVYLGLMRLLTATHVDPVGIAWDTEGPLLAVLEDAVVNQGIKFFYTSANFQNPTGYCMSPQRRADLLALAERHQIYIVEDDSYGLLDYGEIHPKSLKAADKHERVIYLSGFSKIVMPGLRMGYVLAPPELRERLSFMRRTLDLSGSLFLQRAMAHFLHRGRLKVHLRRVLPRYRERRDALLSAMQSTMPAGVEWTRPDGGFCSWVTLPPGQYDDLYHLSLRHGVAFTPGNAFLVQSDGAVHMRLCFARQSPENINEGIAILAQLIRGDNPNATRLRTMQHDWPLV
jgi:DNA-binding transcriptional MocR family regulator